VACTIDRHESGSGLPLITHRERPELYVERFASKGLTITCKLDT
jgi:hypothetical protein